jgi:hypothetical protein
MKHISQFQNNIERLQAYADINGWLPESIKDISAPYFKNFTGLNPHCEDDYDALMLFLAHARAEMNLADGTAAEIVQELASRVGTRWK